MFVNNWKKILKYINLNVLQINACNIAGNRSSWMTVRLANEPSSRREYSMKELVSRLEVSSKSRLWKLALLKTSNLIFDMLRWVAVRKGIVLVYWKWAWWVLFKNRINLHHSNIRPWLVQLQLPETKKNLKMMLILDVTCIEGFEKYIIQNKKESNDENVHYSTKYWVL